MTIANEIAFVGELLDEYASHAWRMGVASDGPADAGVPASMPIGEAGFIPFAQGLLHYDTVNGY